VSGQQRLGGKQRQTHTRPGNTWLRHALTEAARAAARSKDTYLASRYAQLRGRRGGPDEIPPPLAVSHSVLHNLHHGLAAEKDRQLRPERR
jgi:hypothetical protein